MEDILEIYQINTVEQLRAISDPLRIQIIAELSAEKLTVTQTAERMHETPAKLHYHMRELERVGLVKIVETREKGGILEKYYRPIAKSITIAPDFLLQAPKDEVVAMAVKWFEYVSSQATGYMQTMVLNPDFSQESPMTLTSTLAWMQRSEFNAAIAEVQAIFERYAIPRNDPNEMKFIVSLIAHPQLPQGQSSGQEQFGFSDDVPATNPPIPDSTNDNVETDKGIRPRTFVVGALRLEQHDFAAVITKKSKRMDITVFGSCSIADDVSPELVDQTVRYFNHRGILNATPEVKAVLQRKHRQSAT